MKLFLDSSALVKRYIREEGTEKVISLCRESAEIVVSVICITEVLSACNRLVREKRIASDQYSAIKHDFLLDIDSATVVNLTGDVIEQSVECLEKGTIRSLDALHIASAVAYGAEIFATGDGKQQKVAETMGLKVELCVDDKMEGREIGKP